MEGDHTGHPKNEDYSEGFLPHLRRTIGALSKYFGSRLELAAIEGQEAFVHYLKLTLWVLAAVGLLVFGYVFLCMAIVLLVAHWTGIHLGWVSLMMFALHVVGVGVCLVFARNLLKIGQFKMTIEEFRNDQVWLR